MPSFGKAVTGNDADNGMEVSAYFTRVHIYCLLSFVTGTAVDCGMEATAYFTSVLIQSFGRAVTGKKNRSDASKKRII